MIQDGVGASRYTGAAKNVGVVKSFAFYTALFFYFSSLMMGSECIIRGPDILLLLKGCVLELA